VKIGGTHRCGGLLRDRTDRLGRVHWDCDRCERFQAGICQECPARVDGVVGKSRRCTACRRLQDRHRAQQYWLTHKPQCAARSKRAYRAMRRRHPAMTPHQVGLLAGAARAAALSPERRREIARLAGLASGRVRREQRAAA
jgi:hypothetical protein